MEVIFRTRRLQRNYEDVRRAAMQWGYDAGRMYINRIDKILEVERFRQLYEYSHLRLHPLRGSRTGEFSIYLTGRWRLIVTREDTAQIVIINEVSNHYDD